MYKVKTKKELFAELKEFGGGVYEKCGKSLKLKCGRGAINELSRMFIDEINENYKNSLILSNNNLGIVITGPSINKVYIAGVGKVEIEHSPYLDKNDKNEKLLGGLPINCYWFNIEGWKGNVLKTSSLLRKETFFEKIKRKILGK